MSKSLLQRRHEKAAKHDIQASITVVTLPDGMLRLRVEIYGESDARVAAGILENAAVALRDKDAREF